ncbi:MAG: hypothetical protein U0172_08670 [Nitrospiraceae bacterium]
MTGKAAFSADEWATLRDTPHFVAAAATLAGNSGLGTIKEGFATAKSFVEASKAANGLIRDLAAREELEQAQAAIKSQVTFTDPEGTKAKLRAEALAKSADAMKLLASKGAPDDTEAYKHFLMQLADTVTQAAKEGGFLGIGGERVSADEQAFLKELSSSLQA